MPIFEKLYDIKSSERNILLYKIEGGKLNNAKKPSEQNREDRKVRPALKGGFSPYYAARFLVDPVGHEASLQNTRERKIEKELSAIRKEISKICAMECVATVFQDKNLSSRLSSVSDIEFRLTNIALFAANELSPEKKTAINIITERYLAARSSGSSLTVSSFAKSFLEKEMNSFYERFSGKYPAEIKATEKEYPLLSFASSDQSEFNFKRLLMAFQKLILRNQDLRPVEFKPSSDFNSFIDMLGKYGPIMAGGYFKASDSETSKHKLTGTDHVVHLVTEQQPEPTPLTKLVNALSGNNNPTSIIAVGAYQGKKKNFVLYIDPRKESVPNKMPTVYAIEYAEFLKILMPLDVKMSEDSKGVLGNFFAAPTPKPESSPLRVKY